MARTRRPRCATQDISTAPARRWTSPRRERDMKRVTEEKRVEAAEFERKALAILERHGAVKGAEFGYTHTVRTSRGDLWIGVAADPRHMLSIFCMFADGKRARGLCGQGINGPNPHSGKWNWHRFSGGTEDFLAEFELGLRAAILDCAPYEVGRHEAGTRPEAV